MSTGGPVAAAGSDQLSFDTAGLPPDEAFERYRELYGIGTEVLRTGPDPRAKVAAWRLDRMLLYDRRLNDLGHRRDPARTRADGFDHFTATLLLAGELAVDGEDGARFRPRPGEVLLIDTHVPAGNRMRHAHLVTASIARERMVAIAGDPGPLHGLTLSADDARLFREFVESLLRNLPTMSRAATTAATGVVTALLGIAIGNHGAARANAGPPRDVERLARLKQLIDARLADPAFDITAMVRASGLSRATLYRLLAPAGGFATLLRHRRLETVRRRLSDPADPRAFAAIAEAAGLANASHASRAFVDRYGLRPVAYRAAATADADAAFTMRCWQEEVR